MIKPAPLTASVVGELDNGDVVVDDLGRAWIVVRDGGMVERPGPVSAGLAWLERTAGPLLVVYRAPRP